MLAYALWAGMSPLGTHRFITHAVCAGSTAVSTIRVHALTKGFWPLSLLTLALALVPLVSDMVSTSLSPSIRVYVLVLTLP